MKNKKTLVALLTIGLAASLAFAQQHTPPNAAGMVQRHVQHLTTLLSLDAGQQAKITSILTSAASERSGSMSEMKTAHQNLKTAITNNDAAGMQAAATSLGNLMAAQILAHAKTQAAINAVLTADQQTKFNELDKGGPGFGRGRFMH